MPGVGGINTRGRRDELLGQVGLMPQAGGMNSPGQEGLMPRVGGINAQGRRD